MSKRMLKTPKKYSVHEGMEFTDKQFFGDNYTHTYQMHCYDGFAIGFLLVDEEAKEANNINLPAKIVAVYPTKKEITKNEVEEASWYRFANPDEVTKKTIDPETICLRFAKLLDFETISKVYHSVQFDPNK